MSKHTTHPSEEVIQGFKKTDCTLANMAALIKHFERLHRNRITPRDLLLQYKPVREETQPPCKTN